METGITNYSSLKEASFGSRIGAYIINGLLRMILIGILMELFGFQKGTSVGKRSQNLMVIDREGKPAEFGLMLGRLILKGFFLPISIFTMLLANKAVHDMILDTKVVEIN